MAGCFDMVPCFGMPPHRPSKYGKSPPAVPAVAACAPGAGTFQRSGDDRLWLFARSWEPKEPSKAWATLMIVHGTVDHSGVYEELAQRLVAKGIAVFATDMRGWGLSDGEAMYFHDVEAFAADVVADYRRIHAEGSPYAGVKARFLLGKSIGGLITAWAAAGHRDLWTGLIGLSGAYQLTPQTQPPARKVAVLRALAKCFPKLPIRQIFSPRLIVRDADALRAWEADPLVSRGKATVGYMVEILRAMDALPARLNAFPLPVLMLWGTDDKVVSEQGHETVLASSGDGRSKFIRYPGGFHNLLAEPSLKADVMADLERWMTSIAGGACGTSAAGA
mmetsp:Transcript_17874/g.50411  ORF Transcript_17874/g.50411 Transcript_17874/m.50411 type:complete len:334 (+) Transcript_17874:66-1067(+)